MCVCVRVCVNTYVYIYIYIYIYMYVYMLAIYTHTFIKINAITKIMCDTEVRTQQWPTGKLTWLNGFHRAQENTYLCKNRWTGNHKYLHKLIFKIRLDSQLVISQFSIIVHIYDVHKKSFCMYKVWEKKQYKHHYLTIQHINIHISIWWTFL